MFLLTFTYSPQWPLLTILSYANLELKPQPMKAVNGNKELHVANPSLIMFLSKSSSWKYVYTNCIA